MKRILSMPFNRSLDIRKYYFMHSHHIKFKNTINIVSYCTRAIVNVFVVWLTTYKKTLWKLSIKRYHERRINVKRAR